MNRDVMYCRHEDTFGNLEVVYSEDRKFIFQEESFFYKKSILYQHWRRNMSIAMC